jgi:uncharacterized protein (DUF488 family)
LTNHSKHSRLNFARYRKPISTDVIIHNNYCHPNEHKVASIDYLINRLHTFPISKHAKDVELSAIKTFLQNNQYKLMHIHAKSKKYDEKKNPEENKCNNRKWAVFIYAGH